MANKSKSFGAVLARKNGASFDTIPNLDEVTPAQESIETIDVTTHDSTGGYKEFVTSFKSAGTVQATILFDGSNAVHAALRTDYVGTTKSSYKLTTTGGTIYAFDAFITAWDPQKLGTNGREELQITLTVSGPVTITQVSGS